MMKEYSKFQKWCYNMLIKIIELAGLLSMLLGWLLFLLSIGLIIKSQIIFGIVSLFGWLFTMIMWKGGEVLFEKYGDELKKEL